MGKVEKWKTDVHGTIFDDGYDLAPACKVPSLSSANPIQFTAITLTGVSASVQWDDNYRDFSDRPVVIVKRSESPWADRPYSVHYTDADGNLFGGSYDLTWEKAEKMRAILSQK